MKRIMKGTALFLLLCLLSFTSVTAFAANGQVLVNWPMEGDGWQVTYLGFAGENVQPVTNAGLIMDRNSNNTKGIDGTAAATFRSVSYQVKHPLMLVDTRTGTIKPQAGHTYFKSAMMRLNGEEYGGKAQEQTKEITTFREKTGTGFLAKAGDFSTRLASYDASKDTITDGYNWYNSPDKGLSYTLTTEWQRVSEAVYYDASNPVSGADRSGWAVLTRPDWSTPVWSRNWEIVVDDYVLLEVPNDALKSAVYPLVYGAAIDQSDVVQVGESITASYTDVYDVNPLVTPTVKYQWQSSDDGEAWTDIDGATASSYAPGTSLGGKLVRASAYAESIPEDENGQAMAAVQSRRSYSAAVTVQAPTPAECRVTASAGVGGTVTVNGADSVTVNEDETVNVLITPDADYQVDAITVNNQAYPYSGNSFTLTVTADTTISVAFIKKSDVAGIGGNPTVTGGYVFYQKDYKPEGGDKAYTAVTVYYKVSVPEGWDVSKCGLKLTAPDGTTVDLSAANWGSDGKFGIRFFGDGIQAGETYTGRAYVQYEQDETEYEQEEEDTYRIEEDQ